jgi:hypothetical protein
MPEAYKRREKIGSSTKLRKYIVPGSQRGASELAKELEIPRLTVFRVCYQQCLF